MIGEDDLSRRIVVSKARQYISRTAITPSCLSKLYRSGASVRMSLHVSKPDPVIPSFEAEFPGPGIDNTHVAGVTSVGLPEV